MTVNSFAWEESFPPVYGHTSVSFLKHCPGFSSAKNGNTESASLVVELCVKQNRIIEIREKYPYAILIPVMSENKLPEALAIAIGLETYTNVRKISVQSRKTLPAMRRLLYKPLFAGDISRGKSYIIIDDIVTQGGTISALRRHILASGGYVTAVAALAFSADSNIIAPNAQDFIAITEKFNSVSITKLLRDYNIADDLAELTRSELRYLLRFNNIDSLKNMLAKATA